MASFFARTDPIIEKNYESDIERKKNEFRPSLGGKNENPDPKY